MPITMSSFWAGMPAPIGAYAAIVDEDEGKGLKERDLRKIRKVIGNLWDLI